MLRLLALAVLMSGASFAQLPKGFYAWWNQPVARTLNLTNPQRREIRETVAQYRPRLMELRVEVNKAEANLQDQFDQDPVDNAKVSQAIERLVTARGDLTRTLSQMSLKLRVLLTAQQWQQLQRNRPGRGDDGPPN